MADSCAPLLTPTRLKQHVHEYQLEPKAQLKITDMSNAEEEKRECNVHAKYEKFSQQIDHKQDLERFGICTTTNHQRQKNTSSPDTHEEMERLAVEISSLSSPSASFDQSSSTRSCSSGSRGRSSPSSFCSSRNTSSSQSDHSISSPMTDSRSTCSRSTSTKFTRFDRCDAQQIFLSQMTGHSSPPGAHNSNKASRKDTISNTIDSKGVDQSYFSSMTAQAEISARLEAKNQYQMHKMRVVNLLKNSPRNDIRRHPNQHHRQRHGGRANEVLHSLPMDCMLNTCDTVCGDSTQSTSASAKYPHPSQLMQLHEHQQMSYKMLIHPASIDGTIESAAWHLHGQTGGRRSRVDVNSCHKSDQHEISMNTRDIMNVMREVKKDKADSRDDMCQRRQEKKIDGDDATNISIEMMKNGVTIAAVGAAGAVAGEVRATHSAARSQRDAWSTGIAAAIVTGTAARYYKTFFMFPNGRKVLLPIITGALATALSLITLFSCQFMTILSNTHGNEGNNKLRGGGGEDYRNSRGGSTQILQVGPWRYLSINPSYSDGEVCLFYPSNLVLDLPFLVARSTSALASFAGFALVLWTLTLMCVPTSRGSMNSLALCFATVGVLELLTALIYQSETCRVQSFDTTNDGGGYLVGGQCRPNQDLIFCIASSTLYMATGWILYASRKFSSDTIGNTSSSLPESGFAPMEVYTWSAEASSSNPKRGILRTVEKCWTKIPDGSTLMATVFVEQRMDATAGHGIGGSSSGCDGNNVKTTYSIQTEILPA
ncbi:hypothetical protein ACHAXA_006930 [Cyclostephanos tholiformis]|uniref:Uncharacterized protein n=1 Tax=Cyclostephanos tholiformis TaxID=382380 RepID=A0ABD3RUY8_9STRA